MADRIKGWLRQRARADGMTWLWCYQRLRPSDQKMVENAILLGLVADIGDETAAWIRVGGLGLIEKHIKNCMVSRPTFGELSAAYIKDGLPFRKKDGRRKANGTIETYQYHLNQHILPRWRDVVAEEIKPLAVRKWLFELHDGDDYVWETCSKIKEIMSLVFSFVDHNEIYAIRNPLEKVTIPATEEEHAEIKLLSPEQVFRLLERLPAPVNIAALLVAATGVRISECLGIRWRHVDWTNHCIFIQETFRRGEVQNRTKTKASKAPVPMCEALAAFLTEWRQQTPYSKDVDFVFASAKLNGKQPLWGQTMNARFLKPTAVALELVAEGERFGWHRFRHSLSTWAHDTTKDITVSQTMLRHANPDTTAIYIHGNFSKALDAQRQYMLAMKPASEMAK